MSTHKRQISTSRAPVKNVYIECVAEDDDDDDETTLSTSETGESFSSEGEEDSSSEEYSQTPKKKGHKEFSVFVIPYVQ